MILFKDTALDHTEYRTTIFKRVPNGLMYCFMCYRRPDGDKLQYIKYNQYTKHLTNELKFRPFKFINGERVFWDEIYKGENNV